MHTIRLQYKISKVGSPVVCVVSELSSPLIVSCHA